CFYAEDVIRDSSSFRWVGDVYFFFLAIASNIIKAHSGEIRAESKFGEGTSFIFTLPLKAM
ncbi:cell wall metabolism sensor histidine kinase WalK, partial [Rossellomorea aquimaris]|uniref:cell wall metabolism sensor histidine kinase WalK n=1 Tax=Rossellomorea aquimaris TaxID=189382 RepID=UPI000B207B36